jgi:uncharacterized repeat protein (TIGR01451 family)
MFGCLLILPALAAGVLLVAGLAAPLSSAQSMPDLVVRKYLPAAETDPFAPGNEITYEIYFINWAGYTAKDVRIVDTLPAHVTYVSSSSPGFTLIQAGPDQVIWVRDRLSAFEQGWLSVTLRVNDDAPVGAGLVNSTYILSLDQDSDYDNNESTLKHYVRPAEPDLRITKHLWQNSAETAAGNELIFEIVPENQGGTAASSVRITDTLPAGCAYHSDSVSADPSGTGFTVVQTGTTVVWASDSMAPDLEHRGPGHAGNLYLHCKIADGWTQEQWLQNVTEIGTAHSEYSYDNNLSRWTYKPERDRRYGAAITEVDDRTFRLLSDAGFDYVLYYLDWSKAEPEDNKYYLDDLNSAVWHAWRYNLRLVVRVDRAPDWALGSGSGTAPPTNPQHLGNFLQVIAGRWPRQPANSDVPQIYGYVIWNEPNLADEWGGEAPDAAAYTDLLKAAYEGVKAGSPHAWVISAGLATTGDDAPNAVDDLVYLQQMYDAGVDSYFDYLGANPLGFAYAPDDTSDPNGFHFARAEQWRAIMEDNGDGDKRVFGTETGWLRHTPADLGPDYNWMKVSGVDQAHYLSRAYHKARCEWRDWMGPMVTWNLDFAAGEYAVADQVTWFSITDRDREPLRSYLTLQNAARRGPADLWVDKELLDPIELGEELRYAIRYTNVGGQAASGVVLTDTLPAGATYVGDSGGGTLTPASDQVVWDLGVVDTCTYETITLTLRLAETPPAGGKVVNQVEASTQPGEPYTDDNVATVITPMPGLSIHKSVTPALAAPGDAITYTLAFANSAQEVAGDVVITDVVPITLTNIAHAHGGAVLTPTGDVSYTWEVQDLAPGQSGSITITGVVSPGVRGTFSLTNRAAITSTLEDHYLQNNVSEASNTIDAEAPAAPSLVSPADGAATNENDLTLSWQASPSPDAVGYLLDFDGAVQDLAGATQYATGVLADGVYTWTVAAYDALGHTSAYTDTWTFAVDTQAPAAPALVSPADGATIKTATPELTWDPSSSTDTVGYRLNLDTVVHDLGNVTQHTTGVLADGAHIWTVAAYDAAGNTSDYAPVWSFTTEPYQLYLPLVMKGMVVAPDLVVEQIVAGPENVGIVIRNVGSAPVAGGFWVDVYIAPDPAPTAVNQIWPDLADQGLVWGITDGLGPGEALTLNVGDKFFVPEYSQVSWPLLPRTPIYAQVDSANALTTYGSVLEDHEISGEAYNNISGPVYLQTEESEEATQSPAPEDRQPSLLQRLPPRQAVTGE